MGIVRKNTNFCSGETDFQWGNKNQGVQQQKSTVSAPNTHKTFRVSSHVAVACFTLLLITLFHWEQLL